MTKKTTAPPEDAILIENVGPIDRLLIKCQPGRVTVLTGNNDVGKSEALKGVNALIGRESDVTLRDGATEGRVAGFGRQLKLTAKRNTATGELDILVVEEGFSISGFVKPGYKTAEANDKHRLKNLASCLGIEIDRNAVYELVGGRDVYQSLVTDKTVDAKDPADYVSCLKRDCEAQALELERMAAILEEGANILEESLPTETGESDAEVLSKRLSEAMQAKRDLVAKADSAAEIQRLAGEAQKVLEAGQGQMVEDAKAIESDMAEAVREQREMVKSLEERLTKMRSMLDVTVEKHSAAMKAVEDATERAMKIADAQDRLKSAAKPPTEAEFAKADDTVKAAEAAVVLGHQLRDAKETQTKMGSKRMEAAENRLSSETLRKAAQSALSLLVTPINETGVGIKVDEQMRLVVEGHRRGDSVYLDELSEGARVKLAVKLMTRMAGGQEVPALVALDQTYYESLDSTNRQVLIDEVAKTKLIVITAEACRNGSIDHVESTIL